MTDPSFPPPPAPRGGSPRLANSAPALYRQGTTTFPATLSPAALPGLPPLAAGTGCPAAQACRPDAMKAKGGKGTLSSNEIFFGGGVSKDILFQKASHLSLSGFPRLSLAKTTYPYLSWSLARREFILPEAEADSYLGRGGGHWGCLGK